MPSRSITGRALRRGAAIAAVLAAIPAAGADAATYNLRPNGTTAPGFTSVPSGTPSWDVLNDAVVQPALPSTASDYLTTAPNTAAHTEVTLETAAIPAGESVTGATAWVYAETGTVRDLIVWASIGGEIVAAATLPVNSPAGWYQLPVPVPMTQAQVDDLKLGFSHHRNSGTHLFLYATYLQLDVSGPAPPPAEDPPPPAPEDPIDPPVDPVDPPVDPVDPPIDPPLLPPIDPGVTVPPVEPGVDPPVVPPVDPPDTDTDDVVEPALAIAGKNPTASPTGVVPVAVSCPETEVNGCQGAIWLEEALDAGSTGQGIRAARRSPKRFSKPKRYKLGQGKKMTVPIQLDRRVHRKFKKKRSFKVTVVAQQKDSAGNVQTMRRTVRVFNGRKTR